jgi:hypothetical protein
VTLDVADHLGHVSQECVLLTDVVIGGEDRDRRLGVDPADHVRRIDDGRAGSTILGLQEHAGRGPVAELAVHVPGVVVLADDHRALGWHQAPHPIQGLAQQRGGSEERHVLLGPVVAEQAPDEGSEPASVAAGEHDRPGPGCRGVANGWLERGLPVRQGLDGYGAALDHHRSPLVDEPRANRPKGDASPALAHTIRGLAERGTRTMRETP